jgi:mono/diheme cytochrome c family protein
MRDPIALTVAAALALAAAPTALADAKPAKADEGQLVLKDAPGRDLVVANCVMCHSLDYVPMNSPFLDRKGWEGSVNKMIKVMGAPISPEDAKQIVDYLAQNYGKK